MYSKLGGVTLFAKHIGECRRSVIFITLFLCRETKRVSKSRDQGAGKEQTAYDLLYDLLYEVVLTRAMFRHCARSIISRVLSWKEYPVGQSAVVLVAFWTCLLSLVAAEHLLVVGNLWKSSICPEGNLWHVWALCQPNLQFGSEFTFPQALFIFILVPVDAMRQIKMLEIWLGTWSMV